MIYTIHCDSPVGGILLAERDGSLIGLWIDGQKYYLGSLRDEIAEKETPILAQGRDWLGRYFAGEQPAISELKLAPVGGAFRQRVWTLLRAIPYGETTTYGALARTVARDMGRETMSSQAVGGAVGHNPLSIIIPCHRVVGSDGGLTGYAGGVDIKRRLLEHEGARLTR